MLYRTNSKLNKLGFSLVELLVIITVIGILAGISAFSWSFVTANSFNTRTLNAMTSYRDAFVLYASNEKSYPQVPKSGNYCLKTGGLTGAEANSKYSLSPSLPTNITGGSVTETSYFCRDFTTNPTRYAIYPPLNKALSTVLSMPVSSEPNEKMLVDSKSGGVVRVININPSGFTVY